MKVKMEIVSVHTLNQYSNNRHGFDLLFFMYIL